MKRIALFFLLTLFILTPSAFSQDDDWYRPGGFDAIGRSYKTFSVSDTKKAHFSRGNLQYNAAQNKWRFALRQYNMSCSDNANISQTYDGWIDLFAWGTSGWNSGANEYQPWSTSTTNSDYYPGGNGTNDLTGDYAQADWGVYNKITNGGNKAGKWRTLTHDEWEYLIGRNGKYGFATIGDNYTGMVLLPDDWTLPSGVTFTAGYDNEYNTNTSTTAQWQKMEAAGAIFLPAAGARNGTNVYNVSMGGPYWSCTYDDENNAWMVDLGTDFVEMDYGFRSRGFSVRLVKD